jgi:hypothetical protein
VTASFDEISQEWLIRFLEHRIGDRHHPPDPEMAQGGTFWKTGP